MTDLGESVSSFFWLAAVTRLRLWVDADHDGRSQSAELKPLSWGDVQAVDLDYVVTNRRDRHGNQLRWVSHVQFNQGLRHAAVDVLFLREN